MSGKNDTVLSEIDKLLKNADSNMIGGAKKGCPSCSGKKSKGHCTTKKGSHSCGKGDCTTKKDGCNPKKGGSKCEVVSTCGNLSGACATIPTCGSGGAKKKSKSKAKAAKKSKSKSKSKAKKIVKKLVKRIKTKSKAKAAKKSKSKAKKSKSKAKKVKRIETYMDPEMFGGAKKKSKSKSKGKVAKKSKSKSKGKKVKREPNMFIKTLMEVKKHVKKMDLPEDVKDGPAMSKVVSAVMKAKNMDAKKSVEHIKDNFSKFLNDFKKAQHEMEKKRADKKAAKSA